MRHSLIQTEAQVSVRDNRILTREMESYETRGKETKGSSNRVPIIIQTRADKNI